MLIQVSLENGEGADADPKAVGDRLKRDEEVVEHTAHLEQSFDALAGAPRAFASLPPGRRFHQAMSSRRGVGVFELSFERVDFWPSPAR
jgi:hypothetical protein